MHREQKQAEILKLCLQCNHRSAHILKRKKKVPEIRLSLQQQQRCDHAGFITDWFKPVHDPGRSRRISQNHAMRWAGRDLWCCKQGGHPAQTGANFQDRTDWSCIRSLSIISKAAAILQGWRFLSLASGQPRTLSNLSHDEKLFPITSSKCLLGKCVSVPLPSSSLQPPTRQLKSMLKTLHVDECSGSKADTGRALSITLLYWYCTLGWTVT